jgi:hypothetical protein
MIGPFALRKSIRPGCKSAGRRVNKQMPDGVCGVVLTPILVQCNKKYCIAQMPIKHPSQAHKAWDPPALTLPALGFGWRPPIRGRPSPAAVLRLY